MIDAPVALAFTAGLIATVNPCGFAMLPAYLGFFLGVDTESGSGAPPSLIRALTVGAAVSAGFLVLFALAGAILSWTNIALGRGTPWLTIAIGAALAFAGLGLIAGWQPKMPLPRLDKGGGARSLASMVLFGISYAIASLSCTIGPFTAVVATTFSRESFASGLTTFIAYAAGMTSLLMVLTVTLALARGALTRYIRAALPFVQRLSGFVMAAMGAYLLWYGVYEIRLIQQGRSLPGQRPAGLMTTWSTALSTRLSSLDPINVALVLAIAILLVVFAALLRSPKNPDPRLEDGDAPAFRPAAGPASTEESSESKLDGSPARR